MLPTFPLGNRPWIHGDRSKEHSRIFRSDLYSLGITFYQMLTGQLPFTATDETELIYSHIARFPKSPSEMNASIPLPLTNIILKLLSKSADDCYQTARGVEADIPDHLQFSQKLYVREDKIGKLLQSFDRVVTEGSSGLLRAHARLRILRHRKVGTRS